MAKGTVQGRLNREANPIPGEKPGFTPQYIDEDGFAVDVTPKTPFPSGNYVQTAGGIWVPQKGSDDGAANVQLTGSNVEHQLLDQVQISAGSVVFSQNLTHFADKYSVYVESTPASDFWISIRPRRLDGVEAGEGVDRN